MFIYMQKNQLHLHLLFQDIVEGYLCYKTILCHKIALDVYLMNFFNLNKKNVSFSRYHKFCIYVKPADFKLCDIIISIAA